MLQHAQHHVGLVTQPLGVVGFDGLQGAIPPQLRAKERVVLAEVLEQLEDLVAEGRVRRVVVVRKLAVPLQDVRALPDRALIDQLLLPLKDLLGVRRIVRDREGEHDSIEHATAGTRCISSSIMMVSMRSSIPCVE